MDIQVIFFDIGDTLVSRKTWLPQAKETVAKLKAANYRIGLLSNTGNLDREQLARLLPEDFDLDAWDQGLVLLSSETGAEKPALSTFLLAVQHAKVSPWQCLFVGESLTETLSAQASGMHAARITQPEKDYPELVKQLTGQGRR